MAQTRVGIRNGALFNNGSTLWNNLLAYWSGDGTPNDTLGVYDGVLTNGTSYGVGVINNAFLFDGVNDYVEIGDNLDLGKDNWSYSGWFNLNSLTGIQTIFSKTIYGPGEGRFMLFKNTNNKLEFTLVLNSGGYIRIESQLILSNNQWYHFTISLDRNDKMKMYINGVLENVIVTNGINDLKPYITEFYNNKFPFRIGAYTYSNYSSYYPFNGLICEMGVWNRVLTQSEITELYNLGNGKICDETPKDNTIQGDVTNGLVLYLDPGNPASNNGVDKKLYDLSGNGNDATLFSTANFSKDNGGIVSCSGAGDYLFVNDDNTLDFGNQNFTVEYWVRKEQTSIGLGWDNGWGVNKHYIGNNTSSEWALSIGGQNADVSTFGITSGSISYSTNPFNIALYTWIQLVGIREGANLKIYMNGILMDDTNPNGMTADTTINNNGIGLYIANSSLNQFHTKSSNSVIRIYNRALTDSEIQQNYNVTKGRFGL